MEYSARLVVGGLSTLVMLVGAADTALSQDPVTVDPKHYKVEVENDQVRVLRVTYGAHEKSVMHAHPAVVAVFLNDQHVKFTLPDGKTEDSQTKAGATRWMPAGKHLPENVGEMPLELILVELKTKPAAAAKTK